MLGMKIALLADVHANLPALYACLRHARAQGADQLAFLGDIVGYGGQPAQVLDVVMHEVARGAWAVCGNHDLMAVQPPANPSTIGEEGAAWTHQQLSHAQLEFLRQLPLQQVCGSMLLVHASAHEPERWHYLHDTAQAELSIQAASASDEGIRYIFCGHVHQQALYYRTPTAKFMRFTPQPGVVIPVPQHRHWLATVGACGQPRDGDTRAMYALYDEALATLTFHRVDYDCAAAAAAVRATPLPDFFAMRLELGQ